MHAQRTDQGHRVGGTVSGLHQVCEWQCKLRRFLEHRFHGTAATCLEPPEVHPVGHSVSVQFKLLPRMVKTGMPGPGRTATPECVAVLVYFNIPFGNVLVRFVEDFKYIHSYILIPRWKKIVWDCLHRFHPLNSRRLVRQTCVAVLRNFKFPFGNVLV